MRSKSAFTDIALNVELANLSNRQRIMFFYIACPERSCTPQSLNEIIEEMMKNRINPFDQDYMNWLEEKKRKEVTHGE